jgi:hypothetical protein
MGTDPPAYVHILPPKFGVATVNVTPTIDEAWAALSNEHTSTLDGAPPAEALIAVPVPALPATTGFDVLGGATDVVDLLEHAVTDTATSIRVSVVIVAGNRMKSLSFQGRHSRRRYRKRTTRP